MTATRRLACAVLLLAAWHALGLSSHASTDSVGKLRQEKGRLLEMKKKAEKAAAELAETIRREKKSRRRVVDLQARLARQRRVIALIDGKLAVLGEQLERAERELRALEEEKERRRRGLAASAYLVFTGDKGKGDMPVQGAALERHRYFARRFLAAELSGYGRVAADREEKERHLFGIERRIEDSERRMAEQKVVGEKLLSQQEKERRRLLEIEKKKKEKAGELKALRARIARMQALVSRIEREVREKESRAKGPRKAGPTRFSAIAGGMVPPLSGKIVSRFGKQRDPVFDVTMENRGIEIEAPSGAAIRAVGKGVVVFAGSVSEFGKVLIIQHGSGLFSVYGKGDAFTVQQGQPVAAGEKVGRLPVNPEGKSVLYLELRAAGTAIDPTSVISFSR